MRVLLGCVNSAVSLIGYDTDLERSFWYCPADVLRVCGICLHKGALWAASDGMVQRLDAGGVTRTALPGPNDNLAHSIKPLGTDMLGVADTGNSRVLMLAGERCALSLSPLEGWGEPLPPDAVHLNDFVSWRDGVLASTFNHQPFGFWKETDLNWKNEGWGCLFHLRRHAGRTTARIAASGLDCPHSLALRDDNVYCCSSAAGTFLGYSPDKHGLLREVERCKVTDTHFLRGCLRLDTGWLLGGSSLRRRKDGGGMVLFLLSDTGDVRRLPVGGPGEIYDIIPWDGTIMPGICRMLLRTPGMDLEGEFPPRCALPVEYGG